MNWDDLKYLHYVAQKGSFLKAGKTLGMTASTVSRRISQLEDTVGTPLVERDNEGVRLTFEGQKYAKLASSMSQLIAEQQDGKRCNNGEVSGNIIVTATYASYDSLTYAISRFLKKYPACSVDLKVCKKYLDIAGGEADIAIRLGKAGENDLIQEKLGEVDYGFFTSNAYLDSLERELTPQNVAFIGGHNVLSPVDWVTQEAGFTKIRFIASFGRSRLQAAHHGLGVVAAPRSESYGLVEIFKDIPLPTIDFHLVTRPQAMNQPHIRALYDYLYEYHYKLRDFIKYGADGCDKEDLEELGLGLLKTHIMR